MASGESIQSSARRGVGPIVALVLASAVAGSAANVLWVRSYVRAELATRPPILILDTAALIADLPNEQVGREVLHYTTLAQRLAAGGVVVLDARAVVAAPLAVQFDPRTVAPPRPEAAQ